MQVEGTKSPNAATLTLYPLSAAQREVWIGQILDPARSFYNISGYVEIFRPVDPAIFRQALEQAVGEVDGLHVNFIETEDGPRQFFRAPGALQFHSSTSALLKIHRRRRFGGCRAMRRMCSI